MKVIRIANAPCSWGTLEFEGMQGGQIGFAQMLDELCETGYIGTDLGDWGFMPTEPVALQAELVQRQLGMVGAFVPVALRHAAAHATGVGAAVRVARLLSAAAPMDSVGHRPMIVLADANGTDPIRTLHAGRVVPEFGLSAAEWRIAAVGAERIARAVREATGLQTMFHHHCAGFVETPAEIEYFLALTDPALIGLVLDSGHLVYGSGGVDSQLPVMFFERFAARIGLVHFKDCQPGIAAQARAEGLDYFEAVRRGVFCELGQGCVDFPALAHALMQSGYSGWIVVEQDVLPGMGTPKESAARNRAYIHTLGL
ncbi:MAG: sugar phosphate isomerase/epimerase [Roseiflexaceae bacterium]|nr:sugar phosphate isomerase/epimerase [Roseiflexaceae bacterium]